MKTSINQISSKPWAWLASVIIFVLMFYQSYQPGLNWFVYAVAVSLLVYRARKIQASAEFKFIIALSIIAAFAVLWHGSILSVVSSIVVILIMAVLLVEQKLSIWESSFIGVLNLLMSPILSFVRLFQQLQVKSTSNAKIGLQWLIPLTVISLFGVLYYNSSPVFGSLLDRLVWPDAAELFFISFLGILTATTLFAAFCPGIFSRILYSQKASIVTWFKDAHLFAWQITILSLVVLLGFVVVSDVYFRWILNALPSGLTYSEYLHQGVFSLIISVLLASFFGFFVLSNPSFFSNRGIRNGIYAFVGLNALFIIQTAWRNQAYISQYGLTEKRVAVFAYLFICFLAIPITLYGLRNRHTAIFLYRQLGFASIGTLVLCALVNWSIVITGYNLSHESNINGIDYSYLLNLDESNLPLLLEHRENLNAEETRRIENKLHWYKSFQKTDPGFRAFVIDGYILKSQLQPFLEKSELLK
jgi:Domain of unknown function (DUF4153)